MYPNAHPPSRCGTLPDYLFSSAVLACSSSFDAAGGKLSGTTGPGVAFRSSDVGLKSSLVSMQERKVSLILAERERRTCVMVASCRLSVAGRVFSDLVGDTGGGVFFGRVDGHFGLG